MPSVKSASRAESARVTDLEALAWYEHGYAVPAGVAIGLLGTFLALWVLRRWPGALWRRVRGQAYVPWELFWTSLGTVSVLLVASLGAGMVAVERGLEDFQSFEGASLAGWLHLERNRSTMRALWREPAGTWAQTWTTRCPRLGLEGEFIDWNRLAQALGFRNRHRVVAGLPSCPEETLNPRAVRERFRPPSPTWERLRRWSRWIPVLSAERRGSPSLRAGDRTWRVFVTQGGYAFAE